MRYRCEPCRREFPAMRYCPRCGTPLVAVGLSRDGIDYGQAGFRPKERRRRHLSSAAELVRAANAPPMVTWGWPQVRAPLFATATIKGPAGCGKSTFSTATAMRIAEEVDVPVLYVSAEEGGESSALVRFARVAAMMGIEVPQNLILSDAQDVHEADADIAAYERLLGGRKGFVAVDSLSQLRAPQSWWTDLLNSGHGCVFVLHCVTSGEPLGGREPEYAVSMNIEVDGEGTAILAKNRWGPTGADNSFCVRKPPALGASPDGQESGFGAAAGTRPVHAVTGAPGQGTTLAPTLGAEVSELNAEIRPNSGPGDARAHSSARDRKGGSAGGADVIPFPKSPK